MAEAVSARDRPAALTAELSAAPASRSAPRIRPTRSRPPPPWATTQAPWGLGLILVLVAKEVPFLLWAAAAHLQGADVALRLRRERDMARELGLGAPLGLIPSLADPKDLFSALVPAGATLRGREPRGSPRALS